MMARWWPLRPTRTAAVALVRELGQSGDGPVETERHPVEAEDWSTRWREGLGPRRLGRLTDCPILVARGLGSRPAYRRARPGNRVRQRRARIDPRGAGPAEPAGGTGRPGARPGSGSGILTIAAIKLGAASAIGIEVDAEANEVAYRNAARNGVAERVEFLEGDAGILAPLAGPADLLLSNILRMVNTTLLPVIARSLRPGGVAIFSGMEQAEADEFRGDLTAAGFQLVQETLDTGWWGVAGRAPANEGGCCSGEAGKRGSG